MFTYIIHNPDSLHSFLDYGIEIPLLNTRVSETIEGLKDKSRLEVLNWGACSWDDLGLVHCKEIVESARNSSEEFVLKTYELVDDDGSFHRYKPELAKKPLKDFIYKALLHVQGTYLAGIKALEYGDCYHLGGGMHHAMSFRPGGFCMFNDLAIAAKKIILEKALKKILILDLDCHRGDGTAECTQFEKNIDTFSIHMRDGWPLDDKTRVESFIDGTIDVPVASSDNYINKLKEGIGKLELADYDLVFVVHGVDVWEGDALASSSLIKITQEEVLERDQYIYDFVCAAKKPQAWVMGGGYGEGISKLYLQFLNK